MFKVLNTSYRNLSSNKQLPGITMIHKPYYRFSFDRLTGHHEFRKKLRMDLLQINHKIEKRTWPFYKRIGHYTQNNKKKLIFFFGLVGIMQYKEGYRHMLGMFRKMEPIGFQLRRWLLAEDRFIPESIKETKLHWKHVSLNPETITTLSNHFLAADDTLHYGMNHRFMVKLYSKLGFFDTREKIDEYYDHHTAYGRRLNQKLSGVNLLGFLESVQRFLDQGKKNTPGLDEEQFVKKVIGVWDETIAETKEWESKIKKKIDSRAKDLIEKEKEKEKLIWSILGKNPLVDVKEVENEVQARGFQGLSYRDKINILEHELDNLSLLKLNHLDNTSRNDMGISLEDTNKKLKDLEKQIESKYKELQEAKQDFKTLIGQ